MKITKGLNASLSYFKMQIRTAIKGYWRAKGAFRESTFAQVDASFADMATPLDILDDDRTQSPDARLKQDDNRRAFYDCVEQRLGDRDDLRTLFDSMDLGNTAAESRQLLGGVSAYRHRTLLAELREIIAPCRDELLAE